MKMQSKLTTEQIAIVLDAVAWLEGWDSARPSVIMCETGYKTTDAGNVKPSGKLIAAIRDREQSLEARRARLAEAAQGQQ